MTFCYGFPRKVILSAVPSQLALRDWRNFVVFLALLGWATLTSPLPQTINVSPALEHILGFRVCFDLLNVAMWHALNTHAYMLSGPTIWFWITKLVGSFLEKTVSPTPSISYLSVLLCVGLRLCGVSSIHLGTSLGIVLVWLMFRQTCWWDFMDVAS